MQDRYISNTMKYLLRSIGIAGAVIFTTAFWFTWGVPGYVEDAAKSFIEKKIVDETNEKINAISQKFEGNKLAQLAKSFLHKNQEKINDIKQQLRDKSYEKIAAVMAEMRDLSCECRKKYAQREKQNMEFKVFHLEEINSKLIDFMKSKYMEISGNLATDLRIFTASNAAVFFLLTLVSFLKPRAIAHLFLPALLLLASTLICSYFYLFEQDWFFTILYNDYVGYSFVSYIGIVFLFLCDVIFNGAQVTTAIINGFLQVLSKFMEVVPLDPCF